MKVLTDLLVTLFLAATATAVVDDPTPLTGTWTLTIEKTDGGTISGKIEAVDDSHTLSGSLTGPTGDMSIWGTAGSSLVKIYAANNPSQALFVFEGTRTQDGMSGKVTFNNADFGTWSVQRK